MSAHTPRQGFSPATPQQTLLSGRNPQRVSIEKIQAFLGTGKWRPATGSYLAATFTARDPAAYRAMPR
jgi:hypothetical protein